MNIEFAGSSKMAAASQELAWLFRAANEKYATDYPAAVGNRMQSTDSVPFQDEVAAISLRENERGAHIGGGWNPHWHQPTDVFSTFSDKDFKLGLNAAQTNSLPLSLRIRFGAPPFSRSNPRARRTNSLANSVLSL